MKATFTRKSAVRTGVHVVLVAEKGRLLETAAGLDEAAGGAIRKAVKQADFKGGKGKVLSLYGLSPAAELVLVGTGAGPAKLDALGWQDVGAGLAAVLKGKAKATITIDVEDGAAVDEATAAAALVSGLDLKSYAFDRYRTTDKDAKKAIAQVTVQCAAPAAAKTAQADAAHLVGGIKFARDLVTEPANVLTPADFATRLKALEKSGVKVKVLEEKDMKKLGMGALVGVGQGSANKPKLVVMEWRGTRRKTSRPLALVGKGVTFDSGGLSLKPAASMEAMKWDMGGASVVAGAIHALAKRKAKTHVVGVVGLVENMPSSTAQRPGDVVTTMSGQTVEVLNTDAEGRLVLADALTYTIRNFDPTHVIDFATLTGAIMIALGHEYAGLFSTNDDLAEKLTAAGTDSGDRMWRLPMGDAYDKQLASPIADMQNIGTARGKAGSITAAQFLARFTEKTPWAHVDIAGTAWNDAGTRVSPKGATGYGVALVDQLVRSHFE